MIRRFRGGLGLLLWTLPLLAGGCVDPIYLIHVTGGELRSLSRSRPIEKVLASGAVTPDQARQLVLVQHVRAFARDAIGLNVGNAYSHYEDNAGGPVAFAVSAARQDRLEPYVWTYPVVGQYEAKGFFDRKLAEREMQRLAEKGYDAIISEVAGFSTMGVLPDPVRASNLTGDDVELAELIMHELTHNTIYKPSDTQFNESMATFMGRTAALRFFEESYGADSPQARAAARRMADERIIDAYVSELYRRLDVLYREEIPPAEKIARRRDIFEDHRRQFEAAYAPRLSEPQRYRGTPRVAASNATVLVAYRYHSDLDIYANVFNELHGDFRAMIDVLRQAARRRDGREFLHEWLARRQPSEAACAE